MAHPTTTDQSPEESRAVSPVIGVVLMVAITVMLAASIGVFVLDTGELVGQPAPQPSLTIADASKNFNESLLQKQSLFEISHRGGDVLRVADITLIVREPGSNELLLRFEQGEESENTVNGNWNVTIDGTATNSTAIFEPGENLIVKFNATGSSEIADETEYDILIIDDPSGEPILDSRVYLR